MRCRLSLHAKLEEEQAAEQRRLDQLAADAHARRLSETIRSYIAVVGKTGVAHGGRFESQDALDAWMDWAYKQADRIDPLVEGPPSILDENPDDLWNELSTLQPKEHPL